MISESVGHDEENVNALGQKATHGNGRVAEGDSSNYPRRELRIHLMASGEVHEVRGNEMTHVAGCEQLSSLRVEDMAAGSGCFPCRGRCGGQ